jgi:SAM-dependent methyltransferase
MIEDRATQVASALSDAYAQERAAAREYAPLYDQAYESPYWASERRDFVERFAAHAAASGIELASARILDVGTGTGSVLAQLRALGARNLAGNDLSDDVLAIAREKLPDVEFSVGPAEQTDYPPGSFDAVLGFSFLHHLPDLPLFFTWLASVLRPGGVFMFSDPNARSTLLRPRLRWVVWGLVYPVHKLLRRRNRRLLEAMPTMGEGRFYSEVHHAQTREEVMAALPPELQATASSHGVLAPSFNNALGTGRLDRLVLRAARAVDRLLLVEGDALVVRGSRRA